MRVARWICTTTPVVVAGLLIGAVGTSTSLASDPPWQPPPCPAAGSPPASSGTGAWYRLTPLLDVTGSLVGQELAVAARGDTVRTVTLPPESFASGPAGGQVVVGDDDGVRSRLRVVDIARGCVRLEIEDPDVVRSATLSPDGASMWDHRVDRVTRADQGIRRWAIDDASSVPVLSGLSADPGYGPTFVTVLRASADGHLVVASCGVLACRTRVVDGNTGATALVEHTGPPIGLTGGRLVAYEACDSWPCAIVAVEPATGGRRTVVAAANDAELGGTRDGSLVYQATDGALAVMDVASGQWTVLVGGAGLAPVRRGSIAAAGVDLRPGNVLVAPDGRMDDAFTAWQLDPTTNALSGAEEVER